MAETCVCSSYNELVLSLYYRMSDCWDFGLFPDNAKAMLQLATPLVAYEILMWTKASNLTDRELDWVKDKLFYMNKCFVCFVTDRELDWIKDKVFI